MSVREVRLGEICEFKYGDSLPEAIRSGGDVPVYGSNGIVGWHDTAITQFPAIVIGRKGSIGEVNFGKTACWPIDTTYYVDETKLQCDLVWLYYLLGTLGLSQLNKSAAVPGLNRNDAYDKVVPLPPLAEQQWIAGLLQRADRLRRLRRYALEVSAGYLQAVFVEMFGDPMGWKMVKLATTFSEKPQIGTPEPACANGEQLIIRVGEIGESAVDLDRCATITLNLKDDRRYQALPGDLFLARAIGTAEHLGKASVLQSSSGKIVVFDSHVMRLRFKDTTVLPKFMLHWLRSQGGRARFMQKAGRTAVQFNVNTEQIADIDIALPPLDIQRKFITMVTQHERLDAQLVEAARQAEHLFQTLLEQTFGGKMWKRLVRSYASYNPYVRRNSG